MPFKNYLVAGTVLKRPAIQSPNYSPGTAGWTINRDGSAELNNAVIRGLLQIGVVPNPFLLISGTVPPAVVAFYAANWSAVVGAFSITMAVDANNYHYEVLLASSSVGIAHAEGFVRSGTAYEEVIRFTDTINGVSITDYGEFTSSRVRMFGDNLLGDPTQPGSDMTWGNLSLARGPILTGIVVGNPIVTAAGGGAEVEINHTVVNQYEAHRAIRCKWNITFSPSAAAGTATFRMRRGVGIAGVRVWQRTWEIAAAGLQDFEISQVCVTGVSPPNQAVSMTVQAAAGSNVAIFGTGGFQTQYEISDVSDDSQYLGFPSL